MIITTSNFDRHERSCSEPEFGSVDRRLHRRRCGSRLRVLKISQTAVPKPTLLTSEERERVLPERKEKGTDDRKNSI